MQQNVKLEEGYKLMNQCESSDQEQEINKISNKYIVNLNDLNSPTSKNINYIYKMQEEYKKRNRTFDILKDSFQQSSQKYQQMSRPRPNSTRYNFLNHRTISVNKQINFQCSTRPIESQFSRKLNSRLYHSFHKQLNQTFNPSTIKTQRSIGQNRKQSDQIHMSSKRFKMLLPSIKSNKKRVGF